MTMWSRGLLRRLDRLRVPAKEEPEKVLDFAVLSRAQNARLWELYDLRGDREGLTEVELTEFWTLLDQCPVVDPSEAGDPYRETDEARRERQELERAFAGAFHDYAMKYSYIAIPNYCNALNAYRLEIGYRLFEKYGWIAGERDCSAILPLDQWAPEDREALIDLYQRANPECSHDFPPGWKSKFDWRARN